MAIVARILMVIAAYVLACIAASVVLILGALAPQWDEILPPGTPPATVSVMFWAAVGVNTAIIAVVAMLPSFLVIALAEGFAWRSVVLYGVLGGVLALALTYGIDFAGYAHSPYGSFANEREVYAASGIAGGLVYWVFAGRKAGLWKL